MSLLDLPIARLDGTDATLGQITGGGPALLVNVASKCGLTPQYTALEELHEQYAGRGFTVVGVPCNQFGGQEPGSSEEIADFCSATYGVTFPMTEKVEVNGADRHAVYDELVQVADQAGTGRRHHLELREVPGGRLRRGRRPVRPDRRTRRPAGHRRHRVAALR